MDQVVQAQEEIYEELFGSGQLCEELRTSPGSLIDRWQLFLDRALPVQAMVISRYGFPPSQAGINDFNEKLVKGAAESPELQAKLNRFWTHLLKEAFEIEEAPSLTLEEARQITREMVEAVEEEAFMKEVEAIGKLKDELVDVRKSLLEILIPMQISVFERHGFAGEKGYVQARKALLDHYYDPEIMALTEEATKILFKRAGLM